LEWKLKSIASKAKSLIQGAFPLPLTGGMIPADWSWNWWQQGKDPIMRGQTSAVGACTDAYAHTLATLYSYHYEVDEHGTKKPITSSALSRVLHKPNGYQTSSDFKLNLIKGLLIKGNAYAFGLRNDRNEITSVHLLNPASTVPFIDPETKSVFYAAGDNPMLGDLRYLIPARDIMHIRLYTPRHPLIGVSSIENAAMAIAANSAISSHQAAFFNNMSRPSGVLTTDQKLNREQMIQLREAWENQSKKMDSGGVPILSSGIRWDQMAISSVDAQLVEAFNMTVNDIARAFRVPLPLIQQHSEGSTYNNVEQLYSQWLAGGLGFLIEHVEQNYNSFFGLPQKQGVEFDHETLLRTDFKGKVEGYTKLVQGGVMTPNEARRKIGGLAPVKNGDEAYMQQQMVPLGFTPPETPPVLEPEEVKGATTHYLKRAMGYD